ncbi:NtaA/DmoA family FMN-dependent monooxygenase [Compostimonas suwonensis]|uniref:FMN-dependent oxidoreductase (Nitrilotriacetate monooxygenase family) n=1 Tax=Compostimonas suwonensis TaxID=1048394 RepID=A0A2M9C0A3_9MICO|nr:NtaA/DmoA family FMN-dependent monooxygenase [Compostimonas suwonensis]PJJ63773.1 FMN-dependent oxidoreductase (nitrilotriacetate monooxygenase family) [Compostimonas suwonensis]
MSGMHLAYDLSFTHTEGRWAQPGSWVGQDFPDVRMYMEVARTAERAGVDMLFFGDGSGVPSTWRGSIEPAVEWGIQWPRQDMSPIIAAMSTVTEHIGFGLTYSSTFMHPFYVARLLNSLDHVTGGRIAFNVVASSRGADAANYGYTELIDHDLRYERMEEFIGVCRALWDSVAPDAIVRDRATGRFADPAKVRAIDHAGRFFTVKGPLASAPSPQLHPVIVQAGNSPRGIAGSASFADLIFGFGGHLGGQQRHRAMLDEALAAEGRDPAHVGILWATQVIVARTEREARERRDAVMRFWTDEAVGTMLSHNSGYDFSTLPASFRLGEVRDEIVAANASPAGFVGSLVAELGEDRTLSRSEFFEHGWLAATGLDHTVVGDAATVADALEENFAATGSRGGYMLSSPLGMPAGLAEISELLVPELRARGALAPRYPGATLRENLAV